MAHTSLAFLALSAVTVAACGGRPDDEFTHDASGGSTYSASTPASEAGAAGAAGETSTLSGAAASAGAPSASAGAPAASGGAPAAEGGAPSAQAGATQSGGGPAKPPVCVPVAEQCNGTDDNCDGVIDEGCPAGLAMGNGAQRKSLGDSWGGGDFAETCAADEMLVGLRLGVGAWIDQVTAVCQTYALHAGTQTVPYQYSVALGALRYLTPHPAATTSEVQDLICRAGTVMVGVHISQQHTALGQATDQIVIPQLSVDCAEPLLRLAGATPHVEWQKPEQIGPVSGDFAGWDAWFEGDRLDPTQVLVGFHGASGAWVDRVGLTASSLSVALQTE
ncbi:MAG TPA: hypothetical protein VGL19_20155 [Polyangiaceae bacterium]